MRHWPQYRWVAALAMVWAQVAFGAGAEGGRDARPPADTTVRPSADAKASPPATRPGLEAERGIAGSVEFRACGPAIRAAGDQSRLSPMLVRVADMRAGKDGEIAYRVEFIGLVAGQYDLRDYLERIDGSELDLPAMPVVVQSKLEAAHGTDLFTSASLPWISARHYRAGMIVLGVVWVCVPVFYLIMRAIRHRPPPPVTPPPRPLTLAEQLRPLAEAAIAGALPLREQARLELLMYWYWRDRLQMGGSQAEVVHRLRRDPQAGELLRAFEGWLHSGRAASAKAADELAALLEPYRTAPAVAESELAGMAGGERGLAGGRP